MHILEILILVVTGAVMTLALRGVRGSNEEERTHRFQLGGEAAERLMQEAHELESTNPGAEERTEADGFRFSPELFEDRARVMEVLEAEGFAWFSHYSSVDCLHDVYGIEVCGIREHDDAKSILRILVRMYPEWKPG